MHRKYFVSAASKDAGPNDGLLEVGGPPQESGFHSAIVVVNQSPPKLKVDRNEPLHDSSSDVHWENDARDYRS